MSRRELSRGNKGLWQRIETKLRTMLPRQATVVRSDGIQVWVDDVTKYPSALFNVPVGTLGWVFPLAGGKGFFIPRGFVTPIPFDASRAGSTENTTSISTLTFLAANSSASVTLPAGTYRADGMASFLISRNALAANVVVAVRINGVQTSSRTLNTSQVGAVSIPVPLGGVTFTSDGETPVAIAFGFRGHSASGTTFLMMTAVSGTFTRIS